MEQDELKKETLNPEDGWENEMGITGPFTGYLLHSVYEPSLSRL